MNKRDTTLYMRGRTGTLDVSLVVHFASQT
jgi:hypothetical protein